MSDALVMEAVRKTITVDCVVEEAFRVFTADARSWWPVDPHSIHGDEVKEIVFEEREGGEVYEVTADGKKGHWASVIAWEPPGRLVLAWNILEREAVSTEVEVRFTPEDGGTRVDLEHRGWEAVENEAAEKRENYDTGWDRVFGFYEERLILDPCVERLRWRPDSSSERTSDGRRLGANSVPPASSSSSRHHRTAHMFSSRSSSQVSRGTGSNALVRTR